MTEQEHGSVAIGDSKEATAAFAADCLRNYASILRDGLIDAAGHYFPEDIDTAAEALSRPVQEPVATANCCKCGRLVDTREQKDGGDAFGAQLTDKRWTCSLECWDAVVDPQPAHGTSATDPAPSVSLRGDAE